MRRPEKKLIPQPPRLISAPVPAFALCGSSLPPFVGFWFWYRIGVRFFFAAPSAFHFSGIDKLSQRLLDRCSPDRSRPMNRVFLDGFGLGREISEKTGFGPAQRVDLGQLAPQHRDLILDLLDLEFGHLKAECVAFISKTLSLASSAEVPSGYSR